MSKTNQKGAVEISTIAAMIIVAAIAATVSVIATSKYYEMLNVTTPVALVTPKLTLVITPMPIVDETANWQTYTNDKYGFEVKYPNNSMPSDKTGLESEIRFTNINLDTTNFIINISENNAKSSSSNFISDPELYKKIEIKNQNNITWNISWFTGGSGAEKNPISASAINNGYVFEIYLDRDEKESSLTNIYQILSTFKFTENTETKNTIIYPNKQTVWKTGETYQVQWAPKNPKEMVDIKLNDNAAINNTARLIFQASVSPKDTGSYSFIVPKGIESGNKYQFEITQYPQGNLLSSEEFTIIKTDQTAGWKTYKNKELALEFKYPKEWGDAKFTRNICQSPETTDNIGELFRINFTLNNKVSFGGDSSNCSEPRGASWTDFGFYSQVSDNVFKYHIAGDSTGIDFTPNKILEPLNILVLENQNLGLTLSPTQIGALVNIDHPVFKGMAFIYFSASKAEKETFEQMLSTLKFTK